MLELLVACSYKVGLVGWSGRRYTRRSAKSLGLITARGLGGRKEAARIYDPVSWQWGKEKDTAQHSQDDVRLPILRVHPVLKHS